jgi:hypothetical protein
VLDIFQIGSLQWTGFELQLFFLISASQVARITGVSNLYLARHKVLDTYFLLLFILCYLIYYGTGV